MNKNKSVFDDISPSVTDLECTGNLKYIIKEIFKDRERLDKLESDYRICNLEYRICNLEERIKELEKAIQ